MVKVSVIVPVYNGDRYLVDAIDSILAQTFQDLEIIVVDDGSTDNSPEIAQQYNSAIRYFSQINQGVAASRNLGLAAAKGEYIAFLDQDDIFLPHKLAVQIKLFEQNPLLGMVNSGWEIVNRAGEVKAAVQPWLQIPNLSSANLIIWKPVFLGAMLFRRDWLERLDGFDTTLEQTPDVDLVMHLANIGCPAAWVEQTTVQYRQHEANASKNTLLQAQELNQITARFFDQANLSASTKALESKSRYQSLVWSAWRLHQTGYLEEMSNYLYESYGYSSKYPTETILSWIESFKNYSAEYGDKLDVAALSSANEWRTLLKKCLA